MLAWVDDEALARTIDTGRATYWSRSRREYWVKGDTSGHVQWRQGGPPRLRRRHPALRGRPGRRGLPHRRPHLLRRRPRAPRRWLSPPSERPAPRTFGPVVLRRPRRSGARRGGRRPSRGSRGSPAASTSRRRRQRWARRCRCDSVAESPLAAALALVVLACWGVLLVTRGRFRRAVAVLALSPPLGLVAATVEAFFSLPDAPRRRAARGLGHRHRDHRLTAWYAVALVARGRCVVGHDAGRRPARAARGPRWAPGTTPRRARRATTDAATDEPPDGEHRHLEGPRRRTRPDRLDSAQHSPR